MKADEILDFMSGLKVKVERNTTADSKEENSI